jgi:hypothetical protein
VALETVRDSSSTQDFSAFPNVLELIRELLDHVRLPCGLPSCNQLDQNQDLQDEDNRVHKLLVRLSLGGFDQHP